MIKIKNKSKKYIIIVISVFLFSCLISGLIIGHYYQKGTIDNLDSINVGDTVMNKGKVLAFEYNHHKYINIVKMDNNGNTSSYLLHDPNCQCLSKKLNNITEVITNAENDNSKLCDSINKANYKAILNALAEIRNDNKNLHNQINAVYDRVNKPRIIYRTITRTIYRRR